MYQPQPTPEVIKAFKDTTIVNFGCGHNHVVALDAEKRAWSWGGLSACVYSCCQLHMVESTQMHSADIMLAAAGNGGYGRLGHTVQQDEFNPRQIDTFSGRMPVDENSIVRTPVSHFTHEGCSKLVTLTCGMDEGQRVFTSEWKV